MPQPSLRTNIPELSVSELSLALKKSLEDGFARVRVRGELSGLKIPSSGHLYADLKDADSNLNIICWRSTVARLSIRPEDGMDVVCTGKITTYPKSSRYQLIVDSIELAGEGALLKMLEDRRKRLAAEGLFNPEQKRKIPFLPDIIGVVTSPTGAVIRDILHRLEDRFPRHVIVWPVMVQGPGSAEQIAAAIKGFDAMTNNRPDVVIVARGGGSLEDLMAFNEEIVVRAAAECSIPLISAVGHETDTTLIDYAADLRAPTPTGAAEMAVPVRGDLARSIRNNGDRLYATLKRTLSLLRQRLHTLDAKLGDPQRLLEIRVQRLDHVADKLSLHFEKYMTRCAMRMREKFAKLHSPRQIVAEKTRILALWGQRLTDAETRLLDRPRQSLLHAAALLDAFSFRKVLSRGFAVIYDRDGRPVTSASAISAGQIVDIELHDGRRKGKIE